jgi:hypothetical protein
MAGRTFVAVVRDEIAHSDPPFDNASCTVKV